MPAQDLRTVLGRRQRTQDPEEVLTRRRTDGIDEPAAGDSDGAGHHHCTGRRKLEQHLAAMLEGGQVQLSRRVRALLEDMRAEWRELDRRIEAFDDEFAALAKTDDAARRLVSIPGIGVLNATALVAAIGNGATFARGRDLRPGLAWCPANDDRRQAAADGDQQAREQVSTQTAGPWRPGGPPVTGGELDGDWAMASGSDGARAQEYGRRCAGQQAGPDRVGSATPRWDLQSCCRESGLIEVGRPR
jgi:hypothetical protein